MFKIYYSAETGLDNGGISAISKADWPNLSSLCLAKNYITSEGLQSIIFGNWVNLLGIDLSNLKIYLG